MYSLEYGPIQWTGALEWEEKMEGSPELGTVKFAIEDCTIQNGLVGSGSEQWPDRLHLDMIPDTALLPHMDFLGHSQMLHLAIDFDANFAQAFSLQNHLSSGEVACVLIPPYARSKIHVFVMMYNHSLRNVMCHIPNRQAEFAEIIRGIVSPQSQPAREKVQDSTNSAPFAGGFLGAVEPSEVGAVVSGVTPGDQSQASSQTDSTGHSEPTQSRPVLLPGVVLPDEMQGENGVTDLMTACFHGNVPHVKQLLGENSGILNTRNSHDVTALDYAVANQQLKVIDVMLGYGLNLETADSKGLNILHRCVLGSLLEKVKFCVQLGINLDCCNSEGKTALMMASQKGNTDIVRYLVQMGCNIKHKSKEGYGALEYAFLGNHHGIQVLLEEKVKSMDDVNQKGCHLLKLACQKGDVHAIESIIAEYGETVVRCTDDGSISPFHYACFNSHIQCAKVLLTYGADINATISGEDTVLIGACIQNKMEVVNWLIKEGALLHKQNLLGRSALHCTVIEGHFDVVKKLVESGIFLNALSRDQISALHIATEKGFHDIIRYLLAQGAYPDPVDKKGMSPLGIAVVKGNLAIVTLFFEWGASVNRPQMYSYSPLMLAIKGNDLTMVKYLVRIGANLRYKAADGASAYILARVKGHTDIVDYLKQALEDQGVRVQIGQSNNPINAFFQICKTGHGTFDDLNNFIRHGADINMNDAQGMTPLVAAIAHQQEVFANWLIEMGADVNRKDACEMTALMHAASTGQLQVVNVLVDAGADISFKDSENRDALDIAETAGHLDVVSFLQSVKNAKDKEKQVELFKALRASDFKKAIHLVVNSNLGNCLDESGNDTLSYCISSGAKLSYELAVILCSSGMDFKHPDSVGRTSLEHCLAHGRSDIAELILKHGAQLEWHLSDILIDACICMDIKMINILIKYIAGSNYDQSEDIVNVLKRLAIANDADALIHCLKNTGTDATGNTYCMQVKKCNHKKTYESDSFMDLELDPFCKALLIESKECLVSIFQRFSHLSQPNGCMKAVTWALNQGCYELAAVLTNEMTVVAEYTHQDKNETMSFVQESVDEGLASNSITKITENMNMILHKVQGSSSTAFVAALDRISSEGITGLDYNSETHRLYIYTMPENVKSVHRLVCQILQKFPQHQALDFEVQPQSTIPKPETGHLSTTEPGSHDVFGVCDISQGLCSKLLGTVGCCIQDTHGAFYGITSSQCVHKTTDTQLGVWQQEISFLLLKGHCQKQLKCKWHVVVSKSDVFNNSVHIESLNESVVSAKMAVLKLDPDCHKMLSWYITQKFYMCCGDCCCSKKMVGRRVYKTGYGSGRTEGIIISTNVSFQSSPGSLCHGGLVVHSVDPCVEFSRSGDSGAAVVDVESGLVFGLVEAVQRSYFCHVREKLYDHVTFCLPLYPALKYLSNKTGIHLGQFRTL